MAKFAQNRVLARWALPKLRRERLAGLENDKGRPHPKAPL
jgi:hypothetical protein